MYRTAMPSALSAATRSSSPSASAGDSAAVGSSMTRMRASSDSALAISTVCCSAIESSRTVWPARIVPARAEALEQRVRVALHPPRVDHPAPHRLAAEEDVLGDGPVGEEVELLVDDRDAVVLGVERVVQLDRLAVDGDRARVGAVHAGEDLHQGRLAGAVLADDRVDLARGAGEVDAVQDGDAVEGLDDAGHPQPLAHAAVTATGVAAGTSTQRCSRADARTASVMRAARRPSAKTGMPSAGASPAIAA
jgi:hypothetical protein